MTPPNEPDLQPPVGPSAEPTRPAPPSRWRTPRTTLRAGRLMVAVGVVGMVLAVLGMIIGWMFVGQLASASEDSLDVTLQSLNAVEDTIDLADDVLVSTADGVEALAGTLSAVSGSFDAGTQAIDDVAGLAESVGPSIENATSTVRALEGIGDDIDSVLNALSSIPFGPDYNASRGLGETFAQLADDLEVLPGELNSTASSLTEFTGSAADVQQELDALTMSVESISDDLSDTGALVDQYRSSVVDARAVAVDANDDLDNGVALMRLLLIAGGITLLFGQIVPLWLGRTLIDEAAGLRPDGTEPDTVA